MKVRAAAGFECISVHIDGLLHLWIERQKLLGMRSYIEDNGSLYGIVFAMDGGNIEVEYDTREKWEAVLKAVEPLLTGEAK